MFPWQKLSSRVLQGEPFLVRTLFTMKQRAIQLAPLLGQTLRRMARLLTRSMAQP